MIVDFPKMSCTPRKSSGASGSQEKRRREMKATVGMKVITDTGFGYLVLEITGRTANTIATRHLNGSSRDQRAKLFLFRVSDPAKSARILQIEVQMEELKKEQGELYQSLDWLE